MPDSDLTSVRSAGTPAQHTLRVPPLRERLSDVPAIAEALLRLLSSHLGVRVKTIAPDAMAHLAAYDWWKNNVRELRNCLERMLIMRRHGLSKVTPRDS